MTRRLAREEGIFCGISAGGACAVALRIRAEVRDATIVFIVCDRGDRYLSTGVFPADPRSSIGERMTPILVFDIETVPDIDGHPPRQRHPRRGDRRRVVAWFAQKRRAATGSDFAPLYLQQVVAIGCALRERRRLQDMVDRRARRSRAGADPALFRRHRALHAATRVVERRRLRPAGAQSPRADSRRRGARKYWDWGDEDRDFKFNNYLGRYHTRHLDLMDVLAMYQPRASAGARCDGAAVRLSRQARHGRQ